LHQGSPRHVGSGPIKPSTSYPREVQGRKVSFYCLAIFSDQFCNVLISRWHAVSLTTPPPISTLELAQF
jgi:hypothetical protein